ncbi:dipeptidase [Bradyrhizobium sp. DASA03076]|jgi:membrane dipeptidase|uniref:dipeptidase n=1 Tax=Bradyrhizobium sp. BLXBL-03 TaxID=3395916 RepID=UPI003F70B083
MRTPIKTFDGHNDALLRLLRSTSDDPVGEFLGGGPKGHIDLPKAAPGHFVGGFFALYSPSVAAPIDFNNMTEESYALDMPPRLTLGEARPPIFAMIATLTRVIRRSNGRVALCTTSSDIEAAINRQSLAVILHLEGADAIDEDLHLLEVLYAAGLRSLGPVWSRNNIFGSGVPCLTPLSPPTMGWLRLSSCGLRWTVRLAMYLSSIPKLEISRSCRYCSAVFLCASIDVRDRGALPERM